ncbi:MAG: TonB-dependent receptor [Steroidobacteraceae bacterium]
MKKSSLSLGTAMAAVLAATSTWAASDEGGALEEVIVTAQKRSERLVDVPMAVAVLSGEELAQRGIESVQDLSFSVPGLTMREDGPGSYTIFLRGLANQSGNGALVGQYLDEAPLTLDGYNQLSPVALDLARVEVLKGPQGTLYGQGSAGGTVRYITNRPKLDRAEGSVEGTLTSVAHGDFGEKFTGVVNAPLVTNVLGLRFATSYERGGGWIDQPEAGIKDGNGTRLLNMRGRLLWAPNADFEALATIQLHRATTELGLGYEEADRTVDIGPDRAQVLIPKTFDYTLGNLELRYHLGFADLVSATTYVDHKHDYPFTYIPRPGNYSYGYVEGNDARYVRAHQFAEEVRLSASGKRFEWTLGVFYRDGANQMVDTYEYLYAPAGDIATGGGTLYSNLYYFSRGTSKSWSVFGDATFHFTDRITAGIGVRSFHDKQTGLIEYAPGTGTPQSGTFDSVDPRAYLSYKYAANANVYASFAKGFRSGGFNSAPFGPYDPEKIHTYEVGTKAATANGMLQLELAAFLTKYKDMVRRRLVFVSGAYLSESSNIGEVEVKGVEGGVAVRPVRPLTLSLTGAYLNSKIKATDAADLVNIPGDRTDYTPRLSFTLGANYDFNWGANAPGYFRVDFSHRDEVTYIDRSSFFADVLPQKSDSLNLLDARIGAQLDRVKLEVFVLNATDQNKSIDPYQGWANANRTRPRVIGVSAGYQF